MGYHLVVVGFPSVRPRSVGHVPVTLSLSVSLVKSECSPTCRGFPSSRLRSADHEGHKRSTSGMLIVATSLPRYDLY